MTNARISLSGLFGPNGEGRVILDSVNSQRTLEFNYSEAGFTTAREPSWTRRYSKFLVGDTVESILPRERLVNGVEVRQESSYETCLEYTPSNQLTVSVDLVVCVCLKDAKRLLQAILSEVHATFNIAGFELSTSVNGDVVNWFGNIEETREATLLIRPTLEKMEVQILL
jgi:hypothetical protein